MAPSRHAPETRRSLPPESLPTGRIRVPAEWRTRSLARSPPHASTGAARLLSSQFHLPRSRHFAARLPRVRHRSAPPARPCAPAPGTVHHDWLPIRTHRKDLSRVPQRQPHLLVEDRRQGERLRPQLHAAHSHRIRCLQWMASLHPPRAHPATAHRNVKAAHHGPPHDVFLMLRLAAFRLHATAAVRATLRQRDRDLFIDTRRDRAARLPTVAATRLAAWPPRVGFWFSAGVRRRLPLAGS
jgi:hypothetical protein